MSESLIIIMTVGRQYVNINIFFNDAINHAMFLGYFATPSSFWLSFNLGKVFSLPTNGIY